MGNTIISMDHAISSEQDIRNVEAAIKEKPFINGENVIMVNFQLLSESPVVSA